MGSAKFEYPGDGTTASLPMEGCHLSPCLAWSIRLTQRITSARCFVPTLGLVPTLALIAGLPGGGCALESDAHPAAPNPDPVAMTSTSTAESLSQLSH